MVWSAAARSVWGKTSSYDADAFMPLVQHLEDAADVARMVWDWLPTRVHQLIEEALPEDSRDGRTLLAWLAGVHDCGKASPPFAVKVPPLADKMRDRGLVPPADSTEFGRAHHGLVGQAVLSRWLEVRYAATWETAQTYAVIVGGHHGVPPTYAQLDWLEDRPELIGRGAWHEVQQEVLERMAEITGAAPHLPTWASTPLPPTVQALLTGAVIVSDWLASNTDLFPFATDGRGDRAELAWTALGLPAPWAPALPSATVAEQLTTRFPSLAGRDPRPVQQALPTLASECQSIPLLVVESAMGSGKTEAALLAAETLAHRFGCGGIFFALPTMATSDAMFGRVLSWIESLDGGGVTSTYLAHGKAGLNDRFQQLVPQRRAVDVHDETGRPDQVEAQVLSWLTGRKKGVLATMVVGTIDQLLFTALQAKHVALRHLAFAGKVVVIDEAHAADEYMRIYLTRALEWLAAYGVPVVLLSATLPSCQRQELADAYRRGLGSTPVPIPESTGYPLITCVTSGSVSVAAPDEHASTTTIRMEVLDDDLDSLVERIAVWTSVGGCIAVIRNTVSRAQETAARLRDRFGDDVVLHHSRFLATHRVRREEVLRRELGPEPSDRPPLRIVVGTQVLEQSLDVDFDAMVTDLAPVDLVLQRIGRLHRHVRERPEPLREPQVIITGVAQWRADGVPEPEPGAVAVYGASRLLRAAATLGLNPGAPALLQVPDDIRPLVERAYAAVPDVPDAWLDVVGAADAKQLQLADGARRRAEEFRLPAIEETRGSLIGWLVGSAAEAEDGRSAAGSRVRDSEDGIEVVVIQRVDGELRFVDDDSAHARVQLPTDLEPPSSALARSLAGTTVRLPVTMTRSARDFDATLTALERNAFEGWQRSPWLAGQLVLVLDEQWRATVSDHDLHYDIDNGLSAVRRERT